MEFRAGDSRLLEKFLHAGFFLVGVHIPAAQSGEDVEIRPQGSILLQPVLIVGLQPVNAAVLEDEKCHGPVHFVLIFQAADFVVFVQAAL